MNKATYYFFKLKYKFILALWNSKFIYPYLWIANKLWRRKTSWCVRFNLFLIGRVLKETFQRKFANKGDDYINKLAFMVSRITYLSKPPKEFIDFYDTEKEIINIELNVAVDNPEIKKIIISNFLITAYGYRRNKRLADIYLEEAKKFDEKIRPLDHIEFRKIYSLTKPLTLSAVGRGGGGPTP